MTNFLLNEVVLHVTGHIKVMHSWGVKGKGYIAFSFYVLQSQI